MAHWALLYRTKVQGNFSSAFIIFCSNPFYHVDLPLPALLYHGQQGRTSKEVNRMTERTYTIKTELSGGAPIHDAVLTEDGINAIAPLLVTLFAAALAAGHEND